MYQGRDAFDSHCQNAWVFGGFGAESVLSQSDSHPIDGRP